MNIVHRSAVAVMATACAVAMTGSLGSCSKTAPHVTATTSASPSKAAAFTAAIAEVNQYLTAWRDHGAQAAAQQYMVPAERGPDSIRLSGGRVVSYTLDRWVSGDNFTLLVILDLHFAGSPGAWGSGRNGRFITFTRNPGNGQYLMYFATSP